MPVSLRNVKSLAVNYQDRTIVMTLTAYLLLAGVMIFFLPQSYVGAQERRDSLDLSRPIVYDLNGERVQKIVFGQPVMISITINNTLYDDDKPMIGLVEVRGQSGITLFLAYQSLRIPHNEEYTFGVSWTPDSSQDENPGYYSARTFVVTCFCDTAEPLSQVLDRNFEVDYLGS
jgi:hypothetical protein